MYWDIVLALLTVFVGIPLAVIAVGVVFGVFLEAWDDLTGWLDRRGWY